MKTYQIRMKQSDGCCTYLYFESEKENAINVAVETANEFLRGKRENDNMMRGTFFHTRYKPTPSPEVVEYADQKIVRGGHKFKLSFSYFEATFRDGSKSRDEWYTSHYKNNPEDKI